MKKLSDILILLCGVFVTAAISSPVYSQKKITVVFHHMSGKEELALGNSYTTPAGESITVQRFRYYVSNFSLLTEKGEKITLPVNYFLIDEADSVSKTIQLTVPDIRFQSLQFLLGVDSIKNVSGIQTGALDPMKGMFWTWNSGYIMAKLEGTSTSSAIAGHYFTYHIGGFKGENTTLKNIALEIPKTPAGITEIHIQADINTWFKGSSEIRIAETPVCHMPGPLAKKIADNYSSMFSLNAIR